MERQPPPLLLSVEFFPALIHRFTAEPSPSWGACGWDLRGSPGEIAHENATSYLTYLMEGPPGLSSIEAALDALDQQPAPLMALVPRGSALRIFGGKQRFARELWRHYGQPVARVVGAYGAAWERREHGIDRVVISSMRELQRSRVRLAKFGILQRRRTTLSKKALVPHACQAAETVDGQRSSGLKHCGS